MSAGSSNRNRTIKVRPPDRARKAAAEAREAAQQRDRQRRRTQIVISVVVGVVLVATAALWGVRGSDEAAPTTNALGKASGLGAELPPPWAAPVDVPSRAKAAGLSLGPMGTAEHYHVQLDVIVNGSRVPVAANIGVDPSTGMMSGLHTHTPDGIVHIEASRRGQPFTLGQLFTEWNVRLTPTQVGALKVAENDTLTAYVNGRKVAGNPASIRLAPRQQITLVYGPADQQVDIPDSYDFAPGQ